ncbi:hypothetical protein A9179_19800 [Pseudomonas alcaligenes]|uniref:MSHA biogenesis protein MshP n=1 Tax=Aquipseudomonas alcaligenes TaxID=43263 RepID=A0ABR7S4L8_AQUAC|nr:hypothetical protein [Pseudomonas alcaligenes]MBC9252515.1 hypothetical protein [Pseudomonas alcaligenes]
MRPDWTSPQHGRGFGLVAAMFLIIIVTLVIAAMAKLSATQHGTNSLAIQQARAYQAARAGLEWGITQAFNAGTCAAGAPSLAGSNLSDFTVAVTCASTSYTDDDGSAVQIFRFTATAQNGNPAARPDYAYRQLTATVER